MSEINPEENIIQDELDFNAPFASEDDVLPTDEPEVTA